MGFRVIKTAIATMLAIVIAEWVGLPAPLSAGLLAILGVDVTRKRSIRVVSERFCASIVALVLGCVIFEILGFKIFALAVYILIAFPLLSRFHMKDGIIPSTVAVFHIFGGASLAFHAITNELFSVGIGLGSATLVNLLYMPNLEKELNGMREKVDQLFSDIFKEIEKSLRDINYVWSGKELLEAQQAVNEGIKIARRGLDNQLLKTDEGWYIYFYMREQQLNSIERMLDLLSHVYQNLPQGEQAADLFHILSEDVKVSYFTGHSEEKLHQFIEAAKEMQLPVTRIEFEVRSAILQLCRELEQFLAVARKDKQRLAK
ncbi:hypothetical protein BVG16_23410 [Paenibacillus selenitireducens]|uniref:Putative aromatic acid exporter C-terminal domain-containing protein n=1 Tax=Paenibacillus selenitireducens TaxID=1324314 RepID=A0A1T2X4C0_9BACL|nr:aromatic acid exporter family protein [Paenibacillus selenitireducens]OPA74707.1 hypothetical protein BVG16_23410 [Paenibacillus selenitireducens]